MCIRDRSRWCLSPFVYLTNFFFKKDNRNLWVKYTHKRWQEMTASCPCSEFRSDLCWFSGQEWKGDGMSQVSGGKLFVFKTMKWNVRQLTGRPDDSWWMRFGWFWWQCRGWDDISNWFGEISCYLCGALNASGHDNKYETHIFCPERPRGKLHRAFSVFLFDESGRYLCSKQLCFNEVENLKAI